MLSENSTAVSMEENMISTKILSKFHQSTIKHIFRLLLFSP